MDGSYSPVRTLSRGLLILDVLAKAPNLQITEIAREVDLPASTVYRLVETLRNLGFVDYDEAAGTYTIGIRAFQIGNAYPLRTKLVEAADIEMKALVRDINETANLAVRDQKDVIYIHQVDGSHLVRMFTQVGARTPLHASGVGKVLLAWESSEFVRELFGTAKLESFTPNTLTRLPEFGAELQEVRLQGFGIDNEEREVGVKCIAAPIRDSGEKPIAALSVSIPTARLASHTFEQLTEKIVSAADRVSRQLGWQD